MAVPHEMLLAFVVATAGLFLLPGPAMSVIVANGAAHGARAGLVTVLGNAFGFAIMLLLVLLGLQWIATTFNTWFGYVRLAGALYLVWLGVGHLRAAWQARSLADKLPAETSSSRGFFMNGVVVAFANPAVIAFLGAFLPQFIDPARDTGQQFALLAGLFIAIAIVMGSLLALLAATVSARLLGGRLVVVDAVAGAVFIVGGALLLARG
jgi:threonine/homoserine/homoserine lactone efflux protein